MADLSNLLQLGQQMQFRLSEIQSQLAQQTVTASAGGDLVTELAQLPGIGRKTAQRLTFYLLKQPAETAARLAEAIQRVRERVTSCGVCGTLTDVDPCAICTDPRRDATLLCVVEEASDVAAIERAGRFRG